MRTVNASTREEFLPKSAEEKMLPTAHFFFMDFPTFLGFVVL